MSQAATAIRLQSGSAADLNDRELLGGVCWRNAADPGLARAAEAGDEPAFAAELRRHARFCRRLRNAERHSESCDVFLQPLWSLKAFDSTTQPRQLADLLKLFTETRARPDRKTVARNSRRVLNGLDAADSTVPVSPVEHLSWLTILAWGSGFVDDEALVRLWLNALRQTLHSTTIDPDPADPRLTADQHVLLHGELPFLAGQVFQELGGSRRLTRHGIRQLRDGLEEGTDNDGTPHSQLLGRFSLWLSPYCRAAAVGRRFATTWWNQSSARRFSDLVQRSAALTRSSGEFALGNGVALAPASLLKTASTVAESENRRRSQLFVDSVANDVNALTQGSSSSRRIKVNSGAAGRKRRVVVRDKRSDRPACQSDWARLACLRNNWDFGADACVIAYDAERPRIDLTALGTAVISGAWDARSAIDGEVLDSDAEWECVCWFSDRDVDYIELQRADHQATLLRQAMLSRTDHFLFLADSLLSSRDDARTVEQSFSLPVAGDSDVTRDALTREWLLKVGSLRVRVLPISIEQDATTAADGHVSISDSTIRLQQSAAGPRLMSSLVLDWSPARRKAAASWRALTVAEDGRILSPAEAAGFHLRLGDHQWLFYRALIPGQTARTVLGQHTANETTIGELNSNGDLDPLIVVEAESDALRE